MGSLHQIQHCADIIRLYDFNRRWYHFKRVSYILREDRTISLILENVYAKARI